MVFSQHTVIVVHWPTEQRLFLSTNQRQSNLSSLNICTSNLSHSKSADWIPLCLDLLLCICLFSPFLYDAGEAEGLIRRIFRVYLKSEIVSCLTFLSLIYVKRLISIRAMTVITSGFYKSLLSHAPALFRERLTAKKKKKKLGRHSASIFCFFLFFFSFKLISKSRLIFHSK